ncbi:hypothetical protein PAEPH01_2272 [Pancytospora epiphaga]|nr:hypothetical protein PAEPH01_2272 [Pancytospora epiphaga]
MTMLLTALLKKESKRPIRLIPWNAAVIDVFKCVKEAMFSNLERAQSDLSKSFVLTTDVSDKAIGVILA